MQSKLDHSRHCEDLANGTWLKRFADGPGNRHLRPIAAGFDLVTVCERENIPCLSVLHHGDSPWRTVFFAAFSQYFFDIPLHVVVDGQRDIGSIDRIFRFGHGSWDFDAVVALLVNLVSVFASQRLIFHLFDTGDAFAFAIDASQQRSHQGSVGIDAFVAEFRIDDTVQIELGDFAFNRRRHVFLQYRVLTCSREHGTQFGGIHVQYRGEQPGHGRGSCGTYRFAVDLVADVSGLFGARYRREGLRPLGIADDGVSFHALCEDRTVRVHDFSAARL